LDAGFNWQSGSFVYGGETEISFPAAEDTFAPWQFSNPWFGTLRGRAGIAFNNVLLFGTAGLAYGEMTAITSGNSESHRSLGWVAGLGAELSFAQHWSAKAEWIYFDLDDRHFSATTANNGLCRQSGAARAQLSFLERWKCQASLQSFAADFPDRVTFARAPQSIKISLTKFLVCNSLLTKMMTRVKRFSPQ
jgi:outer membrane immunogenic protein